MAFRRVLVTGGCGFIGTNFIRHALESRPGWSIVNLDALTYAGNLANLQDVSDAQRYRFEKVDLRNRELVSALVGEVAPDVIIHFAAESHVDRSIDAPGVFIDTNVLGTFHLLEACRALPQTRFVQVSTDEVYGELSPDQPPLAEDAPLAPNNPYAASKASADMLVRAYHRTYGVDAMITRCSNNYGPYQFPEKLIPLMVIAAQRGEPLPVYGDGMQIRDWLHVSDHVRGLVAAIELGRAGETYHFGGSTERTNLALVERIAELAGATKEQISFVEDRPGHDKRYALDWDRAKQQLDWQPVVDFEEGLAQTVSWYLREQGWWGPILSGDYLEFYQRWYGSRLGGGK